ncbi:hypothetical protein F0L17_20725 [Streptomyces sp. TRM43335]|uniref:DUF6881 domain-containing protein n=1 Tax=Streptomyces taklimakanensis TaxID=2569853 RepID=A0A6G2BHX0_9ACTN|nr:hypothetical protein [Streptomyces taklimakanensis]MTE21492.1 hypothetical protein [Streptomyces taklimakanensis]
MEYWKVEWHHDYTEEPTVLYSEIGADRYETRKIQRYRDGRLLKADAEHETGDIGLGEIPLGPIEDVAAQPEFSAFLISRGEFEKLWQEAQWSKRRRATRP